MLGQRGLASVVLVGTLHLFAGFAGAQDPALFDAGFDNKLGLTFAPDGNTAFWVEWNGEWGASSNAHRIIHVSRTRDGDWSQPSPAPFSGPHSDDDPFVSPDGKWLYFVSRRPSDDNDQKPDSNIWRYQLQGEQEPEYLTINSEAEEYSPVLTTSGAIYFASSRDGGAGEGDIYRAAARQTGFEEPGALGPAINSGTGEWNVWVSPDESEMMFEASSRPTNVSIPGDLYYSCQTVDGWADAIPVTALNTRGSDLMPRMHPDGKTLYYTTAPIGGNARIATANWRETKPKPGFACSMN
jgi:hypothetical protein